MSCRSGQISIRKGRRNASVGGPVEALEPRRLLSSVDSAWSVDSGRTLTTAVPPSDSRVFLGPFGRDELLTLSLDNLPAHTSIVVVYEFFLIGSWNGNAEGAGGATDSLKIISEVPAADPAQNKQDVLLDKTFSNTPDSTQSYGKGSADNYPATSGAAEVNTLGYFYTDDDGVEHAADSVYREYHVLAHDSPTLRLNFAARVSTTPINESYGIGDIGIAFTSRGIVDLDVGVADATEQTLGRHIVVNDDFDERDPSVAGAPAADSANNVPLAGDGEVVTGRLSLRSGVELFQYFLPNFRLTPQFATTPSQTKWELGFPESLHVWWRHANSNVPWQAVEDHVFYPQSLPAELDLLIEANAPGLGQSLGAALYQPQTVASNSGDGTANLYVLPSDRVTLHAIDPDLDADTDNDGTLGRTWQEEVAEDTTGLAIGINDADADGDNTPGYADFAAAGGLIDSAAFSQVLVELPAPINPSAATIRFNYSGSDPSQLGPDGELPADGRLRLWRRNPAEDRNPADAAAGGDYVAAGVEYPLAALGIAAAADARVAALWLEGVRRLPRSADGDYATAFAAYLDPDGPVGPAEAVRVDDPLKVNIPFAPGGNGAAPSADLDLFEDFDGDLLHDNSAAAESAEESNPTYIGVESDPYPTRLALVLDGLDAASTVSIIYHPSLTLYFDANRTQVVPSNEPLTLSQLGLSPSGSGTATLFADGSYATSFAGPLLTLGGSVVGDFYSFAGGLIAQAGGGDNGGGGDGGAGGGGDDGGTGGTVTNPPADIDIFEDVDGDLIHDNSVAAEQTEATQQTILPLVSSGNTARLEVVLRDLDAGATLEFDYDASKLILSRNPDGTQPIPAGQLLAPSAYGLSVTGGKLYAAAIADGDAGTVILRLGGSATGGYPAFIGGLVAGSGTGAPQVDLDLYEDVNNDGVHDNSYQAELAEANSPTDIYFTADGNLSRLAVTFREVALPSTIALSYDDSSLQLYLDAWGQNPIVSGVAYDLGELGLEAGSSTVAIFAGAVALQSGASVTTTLGGAVALQHQDLGGGVAGIDGTNPDNEIGNTNVNDGIPDVYGGLDDGDGPEGDVYTDRDGFWDANNRYHHNVGIQTLVIGFAGHTQSNGFDSSQGRIWGVDARTGARRIAEQFALRMPWAAHTLFPEDPGNSRATSLGICGDGVLGKENFRQQGLRVDANGNPTGALAFLVDAIMNHNVVNVGLWGYSHGGGSVELLTEALALTATQTPGLQQRLREVTFFYAGYIDAVHIELTGNANAPGATGAPTPETGLPIHILQNTAFGPVIRPEWMTNIHQRVIPFIPFFVNRDGIPLQGTDLDYDEWLQLGGNPDWWGQVDTDSEQNANLWPDGLDHTNNGGHGIAESRRVQNFIVQQAINAFNAVIGGA